MSDHIPFEIQYEIMKSLPVKSLLQFRSVSKQWKSVIDSSEFIANHNGPKTQTQHIFVSYFYPGDPKEKYVSIVDDDTFPKLKFIPAVPVYGRFLHHKKLVGSSQGLLCFYGYKRKSGVSSGTAVIWNPSIRKSVVVNVPNDLPDLYKTVIGFAVCPHTKDPKLVKFAFTDSLVDLDSCVPWQVEIYSLSLGVWRTPSINLPSKSIKLVGHPEALDGFIYFFSIDNTSVSCYYGYHFLIMSFDTINEETEKIYLPNGLSNSHTFLTLSKLRESLVLIRGHDVWMMDGVTKSFKKLLSINPPDGLINMVIGFRRSGEAIIVMENNFDNFEERYDDSLEYSLIAYNPYLKHVNRIGIFGKAYSYFANTCTETLLLLDRRD